MISKSQIQILKSNGYFIENMGEVWGENFAGQYRWINDGHEGDGFGVVQYSETEAWADAEQFQVRLGC